MTPVARKSGDEGRSSQICPWWQKALAGIGILGAILGGGYYYFKKRA